MGDTHSDKLVKTGCNVFGRAGNRPAVDDIVTDGRSMEIFKVAMDRFPAFVRAIFYAGKTVKSAGIFPPSPLFGSELINR